MTSNNYGVRKEMLHLKKKSFICSDWRRTVDGWAKGLVLLFSLTIGALILSVPGSDKRSQLTIPYYTKYYCSIVQPVQCIIDRFNCLLILHSIGTSTWCYNIRKTLNHTIVRMSLVWYLNTIRFQNLHRKSDTIIETY